MFHKLLTMFSHLEEKAPSEVLAMRGFQHSSITRQKRLETRQSIYLLFNYLRKFLKFQFCYCVWESGEKLLTFSLAQQILPTWKQIGIICILLFYSFQLDFYNFISLTLTRGFFLIDSSVEFFLLYFTLWKQRECLKLNFDH